MKIFYISNKQVKIDDEFYNRAQQYQWHLAVYRSSPAAVCIINRFERDFHLYLHRAVAEWHLGDILDRSEYVIAKDGNYLDVQIQNLEIRKVGGWKP
jgi:hypothetical protein